MNSAKSHPRKSPKKKSNKLAFLNPLLDYFRKAREELYRVSWPTKRQATSSALLVLGITLLAALFFGVVDFLISEAYIKISEFAKDVKAS